MNHLIKYINVFISAIAIILSIINWSKTNKITKKIAQKTLNKRFFEELYIKNILYKLPRALSKIENNEDKIPKSCDETRHIIFSILEDSKFYKYFDKEFYNDISKILINIDENLVLMSDEQIDKKRLNKYKENISSDVDNFYKKMKEYYSDI